MVSTSRVNTEMQSEDESEGGVLAGYLDHMLDPNADPMRNLFAARCPSRDFEEDYIPYQLAKEQIEKVCGQRSAVPSSLLCFFFKKKQSVESPSPLPQIAADMRDMKEDYLDAIAEIDTNYKHIESEIRVR